jgi:hypothetical protein
MAIQIPNIVIADASTGELVERPMNADELAEYKELTDAFKAQDKLRKTNADAKAAEKAALLERLGLTEDEAKLLLS